MYYVVVDIGCIECGEPTHVLGIFNNKKEANKILEEHEERQREHWSGQHSFEIFEIEELNKEYRINY